MPAGFYALQEIQAVLDTQLVAHPLGSQIMEKLRKHTGKVTSPCQGIKFEIQSNPMRPIKSVLWQRSSVVEPGTGAAVSQAETVPYVLLYFTVSTLVFSMCSTHMQQHLHNFRATGKAPAESRLA